MTFEVCLAVQMTLLQRLAETIWEESKQLYTSLKITKNLTHSVLKYSFFYPHFFGPHHSNNNKYRYTWKLHSYITYLRVLNYRQKKRYTNFGSSTQLDENTKEGKTSMTKSCKPTRLWCTKKIKRIII